MAEYARADTKAAAARAVAAEDAALVARLLGGAAATETDVPHLRRMGAAADAAVQLQRAALTAAKQHVNGGLLDARFRSDETDPFCTA